MTSFKKRTVNNSIVINKLFVLNMLFVKKLSDNVYVSLKLNWEKFTDEKSGNNKKDTALDKIYKCIEKVKKLENKKVSLNDFKKIKNLNEQYISRIISYSLKTSLESKIENICLLSEYLESYLELYKKEISKNKSKLKNKKDSLDLPKKKDDNMFIEEKTLELELPTLKKVEEVVDDYFVLVDNVYYANIIYENKVMKINESTFLKEVEEYSQNVKLLKDKFSDKKNDGKLSPFEKRRRIYIQSMFELDKTIILLENKNIDITFPVIKIFDCLKLLVDNMYKELVEYKKSSSVLDNLMNMTIREYGALSKINKFDEFMQNLSSRFKLVDSFIYDEVVSSINSLKERLAYREFSIIKGLLPKKKELYTILNNKIINSVNINYEIYYNDFMMIEKCSLFMNEDEVIKFYKELKYTINRNVSFKHKVPISKYVDLQKLIVNILVKKTGNDKDECFNLLDEERLY